MGATITRLVVTFVASLVVVGTAEAATVNVVTTTEDLASLTREVGGDRVDGRADDFNRPGSTARVKHERYGRLGGNVDTS